ncbi:MAG: lipopolysaccharide heptosyltransferase II [Thermoanaerobaculia bacterium]|nr:lipopolysaccharide heptosyltransferase II [Thermoanaerobaculia bacterium]
MTPLPPSERDPAPPLELPLIETLVVMPNWVGDCVMALPVLDALAANQRRVTVLAKAHLKSLLRLSPSVHRVIVRSKSDDETIASLSEAECHEAIVLPNSFRSAWLVSRAGIRYRWGYRGNLRSPLLSAPVPRPKGKRLQIEDYRELLLALDVAPPSDWIPRLDLPRDVQEAGIERLQRARLDPTKLIVGHFAGAEFGPSKRWPWQRFVELTRAVRKARPEAGQVLLAGPAETWLGVRIHEESGKIHPLVGPDLDLAGLAGVLSQVDVLVTNDSGPMHMAAALGVPCVALFGPTDPSRTAPAGADHEVLYSDRWCSPCFRRRCPLLHHRCMKDLSVEEVATAVLDRLPSP